MGIEDFVYPDGIRIDTYRSPATMPLSAARTRIIPVSCEAARVREIPKSSWIDIVTYRVDGLSRTGVVWANYADGITWFEDSEDSYKSYIIHKLGQNAWDNNDYIFYYKIEKI